MNNFKVGDKILIKNRSDLGEGTIIYIDFLDNMTRVFFEKWGMYDYNISDIEPLIQNNKSIHIYVNGTTTTAVLKEGNNVIKTAMAKCNPDDIYNFESGARIAFNRLCNDLAESSKLVKSKFRPYVCGVCNIKCGYIGEETDQEDLLGNKLKVGDTVILYSGKENRREHTVCKEDDDDFIMSVRGFDFKQGRYNHWSIIKKRSYNEIENGEIVDGVKYVLSE